MPTTAAASPGAGAGPILLDAEGMERATSIPASWFLEQARQGNLPHVRAGKYVRFRLADVLAALEAAEITRQKAEPGTRQRDTTSPAHNLKLAGQRGKG
jgi:hypothetical protein